MDVLAALPSSLIAYLDWGLALSGLVGVIAAALRAFTGFGANIVWGPVLLLFYGPVEMLAIMVITGCATSFQLVIPAAKDADWRTIGVMVAACAVAAPLGVLTLLHVDPQVVKKAFGAFILLCALVLASGWVYRGTHNRFTTAASGALAGWIGGFVGIGGPIMVLYFMAAPGEIRVQRANNTVAVSFLAPTALAALVWQDAISADALVRALLLLPFVVLGQWIGVRLFRIAPVQFFRRVSLGLMVVIGVSVLFA